MNASAHAAWVDARNLLCVRLDTIGDVLMMTPAIRALREQRPDRRITLLTSPTGAEAGALIPDVDAVITYRAPWMKSSAQHKTPEEDLALLGKLRARSFDAAVVFTSYSQSALPAALMCHLSGIPVRLAYCRENPYSLLTDWRAEEEPQKCVRHEVQRQLDLVASVGARTPDDRLRIRVGDDAEDRARMLLADAGIPAGEPYILVHPGATAPSRQWPAERFADVTARLAVDGHRIVVTGGPGEEALAASVREAAGAHAISLAGMLTIEELAATIAGASLVVTNNTGPAHIAAAVGTPVVVLYALTNPQHTPWRVPSRVLSHDVPCRNCYKSACPEGHHACLRMVPADEVIAAARELLAASDERMPAEAAI